jgi:type I restriction enzyme M protein
MTTFLEKKEEFNKKFRNKKEFKAFIPVHTNINTVHKILNEKNEPLEEYYKWQFFYAIVNSGLYPKDYLGCEVYFPKGNKNSNPIKIDGAIFDDKNWFETYKRYWDKRKQEDLEWLRKHLIGVIEFKREDKDVETTFNIQLHSSMKESEADFCIGFLYDKERLYIFQKKDGKILRYNQIYNLKGEKSSLKDLSLQFTDPYINIPSFEELKKHINKTSIIDRSNRTINDLEKISGINSIELNNALAKILQTMDKVSLINQKGYELLIQILALKIYDEKRNEKTPTQKLQFYITDEEYNYKNLNDPKIQPFIKRMKNLLNDAKGVYYEIFKENILDFKSPEYMKVLVKIVKQFQDYSFIKSYKTDLYQIVFYRFANTFAKEQKGQFITPLPIIDFIVKIVNPRDGETIIDPTVGIGDFLSISFINSKSKLDDNNIYGIDNDRQMIMLARLNMLLNGDGNAKLFYIPDRGSITHKITINNKYVELIPDLHSNGKWDNWQDDTQLKKFDGVLTNPPFGENRKWQPNTSEEEKYAQLYELWHIARQGNWIDLGFIFLENAYRILKTNGRLGIILSNSLASIERWEKARKWLLDKMRIVALFDLPANVFADTGVNTTIIIAYKPENKELKKLQEQNYEIFIKDIKKVGYKVKTKNRIKYFEPIYKINEETFEVEQDQEGNPLLDEEFTETIKEFKEWAKSQEETLQELFIKDK